MWSLQNKLSLMGLNILYASGITSVEDDVCTEQNALISVVLDKAVYSCRVEVPLQNAEWVEFATKDVLRP